MCVHEVPRWWEMRGSEDFEYLGFSAVVARPEQRRKPPGTRYMHLGRAASLGYPFCRRPWILAACATRRCYTQMGAVTDHHLTV